MKSNILLLVLIIIFITGCNGANNEAIPYDTSNLEVKAVTQLNKKPMIEFEELEEIEEETKEEIETQDESEKTEKNEEVKAPEKTEQKIVISDEDKSNYNISDVDQKTGLYIVSNPSSIEVYLNKNRKLPAGYAPNDLVEPDVSHTKPKGDERRLLRKDAASALETLFSTAFEEEGIELAAVSGYRSHQTQTNIYQGHVNRSGQDYANRFSARPGTSEHETGLAMDVSAAV
ncbi:M15 family metallopeptidase [Amphibacillus xylanus]|uniref:Peptidase M15 family protein n=1 Tax=Amphibacillus xylanus (strain ATCC 51415 / DSM 6626 / JCM 7361 / LMG 17667 / NBRC 15112 / Ep01) TaxID=698758 RepID=K0IZJ8_AMPXN|nr:M15 family metallopeptidase [Amphibacillus xylanus]BAM47980.1 peptidase M15 family protein [Amphibacillus xylanus NBRC 15112]